MRFSIIIALLIFAGQPLSALTPTSTTAPEIFDTIIEKSASRSTRFRFEQTTQMMGMTINGAGEGTYDLPRARTDLTFETPIGQIAVRTISDGKTLWQIEETPLGNKAIRHDISEPMETGSGPVDPFMAFAGVRTKAFLDAILETFDARVEGIDESASPSVHVMKLSPRGGGQMPTLEFRIGVDDAFPRQMSIYSPEGQEITSMRITSLEFGITADNALFNYVPGADDQVVDASELSAQKVRPPNPRPNLEGQVAPDFKLTSLNGREVSLSSLRGQHVLIDFWATWCPPCKKALPHIQALSKGTKGLVVLTVNAEPASIAKPFLKRNGFTFTTLVDADRRVSADYGVTAIPTTFIITPDGTVARQMVGYHTEKQLKQALRASGLKM